MLIHRKIYAFYCLLLLLIYLVMEIGSFTVYTMTKKKMFSFSQYWSTQITLSQASPFEYRPSESTTMYFQDKVIWNDIYEVIHPYLGFVHDPRKMKAHSEYGFPGDKTPFVPKTEQNIIIGMLGGSFAEQTATLGKDALIRTLRQSSDFATKDIIIVPLALGGYKQPQQLLTLTYFLALGASFDIVINLDGFNEVALSPTENIPKQVYPFFPRSWFMRIHNIRDSQTLLMVGKTVLLYERQRNMASFFVKTPFRYSITANMLWGYYNKYLANAIVKQELDIQQTVPSETDTQDYGATGPAFHCKNDDEMYLTFAEFWKQCSLQLYRICAGNGIVYYHFLQPNQYVQGSKMMSAEELKIAFSETHPYRHPVEQGYPYLRRAGNELGDAGVQFVDLTMVFSNNADILYTDNMCHLNTKGYELIGTAIGQHILDFRQKASVTLTLKPL